MFFLTTKEMRKIFLMAIVFVVTYNVHGQNVQIRNLYWSSGSVGLQNGKVWEGQICYMPGWDVVFYKTDQLHEIKTYHISLISWLRYYDNGIKQNRQFVKMKMEGRNRENLHEVISLGGLHIIRLAHPYNWEYDEVSQQWMDRDYSNNRYQYQIAYTAADYTVKRLEEDREKSIYRFIQTYELDCYAPEDQKKIMNYYQQQENIPFVAWSFK